MEENKPAICIYKYICVYVHNIDGMIYVHVCTHDILNTLVVSNAWCYKLGGTYTTKLTSSGQKQMDIDQNPLLDVRFFSPHVTHKNLQSCIPSAHIDTCALELSQQQHIWVER